MKFPEPHISVAAILCYVMTKQNWNELTFERRSYWAGKGREFMETQAATAIQRRREVELLHQIEAIGDCDD